MTEGKYNFVGFDPRGVNNSGILLTCFPGEAEAREDFLISGSSDSDYESYYQALAIGEWCTKVNNDTAVKYAGTSAVVQDMMHFTELQAALNGHDKPDQAEIWYWGISYGTVIGQTLAALYPNRIGRVVVDGNVNSEQFYNGLMAEALQDTMKAFRWFFDTCAEAGPKKCDFAGNSSSGAEVKQRFDDLLAKLEKAPAIAVDTTTQSGPIIVTKSRVLNLAFQALYAPFSTFDLVATGLAGLEENNATIWVAVEDALNGDSEPGPFDYNNLAEGEALTFITGIDAAGRYPIKSADEYLKMIASFEKDSPYTGGSFARANGRFNAGKRIVPPESQYFAGMLHFSLTRYFEKLLG